MYIEISVVLKPTKYDLEFLMWWAMILFIPLISGPEDY